METNTLNKRQQELLELILSGTPWRSALDQLGYSDGTSKSDILKSAPFRKAMADNIEGMLAMNGVASVMAIEEVMNDPNQLGSAVKMKAATEFLDRAGHGKVDKTKEETVTHNVTFILPEKKEELDG